MKKIKVFKDKEGNKLTFKEFMKKWGEGIEGISPLQKIKTQIGGTRIMLIGLFLGLCVSIYGWKNLWWVGIILIGALLNTGVQYLGLIQQRKLLDNLEKQFNEPEEPQDNSPQKELENGDNFIASAKSRTFEPVADRQCVPARNLKSKGVSEINKLNTLLTGEEKVIDEADRRHQNIAVETNSSGTEDTSNLDKEKGGKK